MAGAERLLTRWRDVGDADCRDGGGRRGQQCLRGGRIGRQVRFVGKVGADALAERLRQALENHGVRTYLACDGQAETGTTVALGFSTGHRHFLSCLPNNESLTFEDIDLAALDGCTHLLRADVWFSPAMLDGRQSATVGSEARHRSVTTSLDINFDPCWSSAPPDAIAHRKQLLRSVLSLVDIAHGNIRELCEFTDSPDLDAALMRLDGWGVQTRGRAHGGTGAGYYCQRHTDG